MRTAVVCVILALFTLLPMVTTAQPAINIYTDTASYALGDMIEVSLAASNPGDGMAVDVYVGLLTHGGDIYCLKPAGWILGIEPWIAKIYVPEKFNLPLSAFWWFDLPCSMPAIETLGEYKFAALLTYPGTFDWACALSLAPFSVVSSEPPTDIEMVSIPAGSFLMGSPDGEDGHEDAEGPQRTVNISAFFMSETEITQEQWEAIMDWNDFGFIGDDNPVERASWFDCALFCNELSDVEGYTKCYAITNITYNGDHIAAADVTCDFEADGYRLPTEAEWEYACRAGTTSRFHSGDSESDLDLVAWYSGNAVVVSHPVAEKTSNSWGLYDMHGNVWEWCWDCYDPGYYGTSPDPDTDPTGPSSGSRRVIRGGSWSTDVPYCRSAYRYGVSSKSFHYSYGFRVIRRP